MNTECTTTSAHGKPCARASGAASFVCSVNASKPLSVRYCIGDRGLRCDGRAYSTVVEGCARYSVHTGGGRKALTISLRGLGLIACRCTAAVGCFLVFRTRPSSLSAHPDGSSGRTTAKSLEVRHAAHTPRQRRANAALQSRFGYE